MLDGKALGHAGSQFGGKIRIVSLTMIRSRGSVPDGRMSTRPRPSTSVRQASTVREKSRSFCQVVAGRNALVDEYLRQKLQVGRQFGKASALRRMAEST